MKMDHRVSLKQSISIGVEYHMFFKEDPAPKKYPMKVKVMSFVFEV
jgi:hypothetical protein